jgi:hypothetical protein
MSEEEIVMRRMRRVCFNGSPAEAQRRRGAMVMNEMQPEQGILRINDVKLL